MPPKNGLIGAWYLITTTDRCKAIFTISRGIVCAEVCCGIAYNAMLQAGRALMFSRGFRSSGRYKHISVVKFLHEIFGKELSDRMILIFDRLRKKRHRATYEEPEVISEYMGKRVRRESGKILRKKHFL